MIVKKIGGTNMPSVAFSIKIESNDNITKKGEQLPANHFEDFGVLNGVKDEAGELDFSMGNYTDYFNSVDVSSIKKGETTIEFTNAVKVYLTEQEEFVFSK